MTNSDGNPLNDGRVGPCGSCVVEGRFEIQGAALPDVARIDT
jgi:hypothetical protein